MQLLKKWSYRFYLISQLS